ncbi:hypothetical protein FV227_10620 [Methylobacterium sp. WL119]|uniref:hypothetical protein n=1 Tax=unclassified Methylobacterium TaxID=2615210 RepID=UPI0011CA0F4E|nr:MULTISPECIES: hypothetical protein [unclassified Methylobacterium]TXN40822.1 hypothetical protein FV225_04855 [Methylobacterium sp. WL93]TXN50722.1 hypothetical protein FV227_10620 [Methylobacterium sp. WL119]
MPSIDVIGRITGAAGGIDSTTSVGSDTLSQANNSAQLSAMGAGLFTAVAPLTAVTAGMVAADLQINKLIADHNQGASTNTQVADVITLIGDISIIGGGLSAYVGAAPVGELFGALGASG